MNSIVNFVMKHLLRKKSKHNKTRPHEQKERMIIYKYHIEKPGIYEIVEIIIKFVNELQNDFESGNVSLLFNNEYDIEIMRAGFHNIQILESYLTFLGWCILLTYHV